MLADFDRLLLAIEAAEAGPVDEDLAAAPIIDIWKPVMANHLSTAVQKSAMAAAQNQASW